MPPRKLPPPGPLLSQPQPHHEVPSLNDPQISLKEVQATQRQYSPNRQRRALGSPVSLPVDLDQTPRRVFLDRNILVLLQLANSARRVPNRLLGLQGIRVLFIESTIRGVCLKVIYPVASRLVMQQGASWQRMKVLTMKKVRADLHVLARLAQSEII